MVLACAPTKNTKEEKNLNICVCVCARCSCWSCSELWFPNRCHLLKFAKKKSLDLVHWIILSDHCSINLCPWNHHQLACYSQSLLLYHNDKEYPSACMCVYIPWTCVSSFALYSWLLMANSTPYPDRYTFLGPGF